MMLEWLAYILRRNVAVQQEVCVVILGVKLSLGAQETELSKERNNIQLRWKEYTFQER